MWNVTSISPSPGIYFEKIRNLKFYESYWKLVMHLDLSTIDLKLNLIHNNLEVTKNLCGSEEYLTFSVCNTSLKILDIKIPSLVLKHDSLKELVGHSRPKRGLFDGIGTAFKALFGTLDHKDAEYFNDAINMVNSDEKQFIQLLKEQVQVVQTTIHNFDNSITNVSENNKLFDENIKKIRKLISGNTKNYFDIARKQTIEEHLSLLTLIVEETDKELTDIINSILFAKNNLLHPIIITPSQYINELIKTTLHLPILHSYAYPLKLENAFQLMSITNLKLYIMQNKLIFIISNPLVIQVDYNLFNLIPLPTKFDTNVHAFILPKYRYLAITNSKVLFTYLPDLKNCQNLNDNNYICKNYNPSFSTQIRPNCEIELLFQPTKIPEVCDVRITKMPSETWHKLHVTNTWIFVIPKSIVCTLNCDKISKPIDINLSDTGILTLDSSCKLYSPTAILTPEKVTNNKLQSSVESYLPQFNISEDNCLKPQNKNFNTTELFFAPHSSINLDIESLDVASHKLSQINEDINKFETKNHLPIYQNTYVVYIILTIVKILPFYIAYKFVNFLINRYCKNRKHSHESSCITNCITFKMCKRKYSVATDSNNSAIELESVIPDSDNTNMNENHKISQLRRSSRLAKLKENIE